MPTTLPPAQCGRKKNSHPRRVAGDVLRRRSDFHWSRKGGIVQRSWGYRGLCCCTVEERFHELALGGQKKECAGPFWDWSAGGEG